VGLATRVGLNPTQIRRNHFAISLLAYYRKREPNEFTRWSRSERMVYSIFNKHLIVRISSDNKI